MQLAKLKENSTILKHTGEEIIATEESVDEKLQDYAKIENIPTKLNQLKGPLTWNHLKGVI